MEKEARERELDRASKKACPEGVQVQGPSGAYRDIIGNLEESSMQKSPDADF